MSVVELSAKGRLVQSAEQLFAEKGLEGASLREISIHAGQKNTSAVQYHFRNKEGLIAAIWQKHARQIDQDRTRMQAQFGDARNLRSLVELLILPVANKLYDEDGGRYYIQVMSHLISYSGRNMLEFYEHVREPSTQGVLEALEPYTEHLSEADKTARKLLVSGLLFHSLADYIRLSDCQARLTENLRESDMIRNLVSMIIAAIQAD